MPNDNLSKSSSPADFLRNFCGQRQFRAMRPDCLEAVAPVEKKCRNFGRAGNGWVVQLQRIPGRRSPSGRWWTALAFTLGERSSHHEETPCCGPAEPDGAQWVSPVVVCRSIPLVSL